VDAFEHRIGLLDATNVGGGKHEGRKSDYPLQHDKRKKDIVQQKCATQSTECSP
jgi:hypothetical protein